MQVFFKIILGKLTLFISHEAPVVDHDMILKVKKLMGFKIFRHGIAACACISLLCAFINHSGAQQANYEGYYQFLGNYPHDREYYISDECQGVAHDNDDWFFATRWKLYRIPVTVDLNLNNMAVAISQDVGDLAGSHNHIGDPDYRAYSGKGYVFAPLEGGTAAIGVFDGTNLAFLCQDEVHTCQEGHSSWVAIHPISPDGGKSVYVYASKWEDVSSLCRYTADLDLIYKANPQSGLWLDFLQKSPQDLTLFEADGQTPVDLDGVQGGEFSPSGELIYITSNSRGISVFDTNSGRLVNESSVVDEPFKYEYYPGWSKYEEPEGLTIWDLEDGRAPNISGSLHVVMLDCDSDGDPGGDPGDLYFKHYTRRIYVDSASTDEYFGKPGYAYNTVIEAVQLAKDGQEIVVTGGTYNEQPIIEKKVLFTGQDGVVTIGGP